jgi:uncharacterized protein (DUF1697 family)
MSRSTTCIALLRGINVGGRHKIGMSDLRAVCTELGWLDVHSYIQSGNLIFRADSTAESLEHALERAIEQRFMLAIPVIVRTAADWAACVAGNPYREAAEREPTRVMLALSKVAPRHDAVSRLRERAVNGERVAAAGDALWIHFRDGVAASKLSPALLDRLVGSPVTMRNWRTVLTLEALTRSTER